MGVISQFEGPMLAFGASRGSENLFKRRQPNLIVGLPGNLNGCIGEFAAPAGQPIRRWRWPLS